MILTFFYKTRKLSNKQNSFNEVTVFDSIVGKQVILKLDDFEFEYLQNYLYKSRKFKYDNFTIQFREI